MKWEDHLDPDPFTKAPEVVQEANYVLDGHDCLEERVQVLYFVIVRACVTASTASFCHLITYIYPV